MATFSELVARRRDLVARKAVFEELMDHLFKYHQGLAVLDDDDGRMVDRNYFEQIVGELDKVLDPIKAEISEIEDTEISNVGNPEERKPQSAGQENVGEGAEQQEEAAPARRAFRKAGSANTVKPS